MARLPGVGLGQVPGAGWTAGAAAAVGLPVAGWAAAAGRGWAGVPCRIVMKSSSSEADSTISDSIAPARAVK
jgi:hypothetical protein